MYLYKCRLILFFDFGVSESIQMDHIVAIVGLICSVITNVNILRIVEREGWRLRVSQTKLLANFPLVKIAFELFGSDHAGVRECWFHGCISFLPRVGYFSQERTWCHTLHVGDDERVLFWTLFRSDYHIYKVLPKPNMLSGVYADAIP